MKAYLEASEYIDWQTPNILNKAKELAQDLSNHQDITKTCFEFVRNNIKHSWDDQLNPVTCKASDILQHETGYCFAKSLLLAALLRANHIPTALCYQRLTIEVGKPPFSLHGFNAVFLPDFDWYRIDARGNKKDVDTQFIPHQEQLAFDTVYSGEIDFSQRFAKPLDIVVQSLTKNKSFEEFANNLPDLKGLTQS